MSWKQVRLYELGVITTGSTPNTTKSQFYGGKIPFVTPAELDREFPIMESSRTLSTDGAAEARILPEGTVMVSCIGTLGKVGIAGCPVATNQQINAVIFDNALVWPRYGYYACRLLKQKMECMAPATTLPIVSKSKFQELTIPLPPLAEQKRIAAILDAADAMRAKRREAIALLDTLLHSTFLDMFGDPVTNPMGWEMEVIGNLLKSATYGTSKKANSEKGSYPILRMNNITYSGEWDFSSLKYIDLNEKELSKHLVHQGELLFNRTNSKELVGKTAIFRKSQPMAFAGYLVRGIVNESADPEYIGAFMNTPQIKTFLRNKCKNIVGMANINAKEFQNIPIPKPPIKLQHQFATIVKSVEHQKALHRAHLAEVDALFASLQQRAFNRELSK